MTIKKAQPLSARHATLGTMSLIFVLFLAFMLYSESLQAKEEPPEISQDGLHRLHDTKVALAYAKPDADFSVYNRLLILDCHVAFKKNSQRDQNDGRKSLG